MIECCGTDLRSVPEQSLADSIFSLEEGNVQNLECLTACARAWGGGGACVSYGLSASGALLRTRCSRPVRLAICFSMASIRSLQTQEDNGRSIISALSAISLQPKQAVPPGVFTWSPSRSPAGASQNPPRPLPLLQDRPSGRAARR